MLFKFQTKEVFKFLNVVWLACDCPTLSAAGSSIVVAEEVLDDSTTLLLIIAVGRTAGAGMSNDALNTWE
jgi:hypothetical protein